MELKFKARRLDQEDSKEQTFTLQDIANLSGLFPAYGNWRQYTGLKDKHGKEVYERDTVRCGYGTGRVIFKGGCFMVEWTDDKEAYLEFLNSRNGKYTRQDDELFEVIGNIFENKELLN